VGTGCGARTPAGRTHVFFLWGVFRLTRRKSECQAGYRARSHMSGYATSRESARKTIQTDLGDRSRQRHVTMLVMLRTLSRAAKIEGKDDYGVQWRELKKRRNLALFAFIGYVPITFAFGLLTHHFFQSEKPVFVFAIAWMLFYAVAGNRCNNFHCPRCGKSFFSKWWYHNGFARRCVHCKLPLYGPKEQTVGQR
jgi:hypothetical protein